MKYTEEAYAAPLSGPLSPEDTGRSEETPAILMIRLTAENPSGSERQAHFWLSMEMAEQLVVADNRVEAMGYAKTQAASDLKFG